MTEPVTEPVIQFDRCQLYHDMGNRRGVGREILRCKDCANHEGDCTIVTRDGKRWAVSPGGYDAHEPKLLNPSVAVE